MNIQAVINNVSFPKTLDSLEYFVLDIGCFNIEEILYSSSVEWTMPKWALQNDIVFFYHAKSTIQKIRHLETALKQQPNTPNFDVLWEGLKHARKLYSQYGGKIFAIGRVTAKPQYEYGEWQTHTHWNSRVYAEIGDIWLLKHPVDLSDFSDFIQISRQSAITPVLGNDFEKLRNVITQTNDIPLYLKESIAAPFAITKITKENWLESSYSHRRSFYLEIQFRRFYVDFFLSIIADQKRIYTECACYKNGELSGYVDNCIYFNGKWQMVEVKLNMDAESKLTDQLMQYAFVDYLSSEKHTQYTKDIRQQYVFVIDTQKLCIFDGQTKNLFCIAELDEVKTTKDIISVKEKLISWMMNTTHTPSLSNNTK